MGSDLAPRHDNQLWRRFLWEFRRRHGEARALGGDGLLKGAVRDYDEAVLLGVIDAGVRDLIQAMNAAGMRTFASCEGHGWLRMNQPPYVCFTSGFRAAARLANALHRADSTGVPHFRGSWSIRLFGEAADHSQQQFMLIMSWTGRDCWPLIRPAVRDDLELLARLVCADTQPVPAEGGRAC